MKKPLFIALCALCLVCFGAQAVELKLSIGMTKFTDQDNGIWRQTPYDYKLKTVLPSVGIKVYTGTQKDDWQAGLGYAYLGQARSSARAVASDLNYSEAKQGCNSPCWPLSHWEGRGSVQGISLTAKRNFGFWYFEGGLMANKPKFSMHIPDLYGCTNTPANAQGACAQPDIGPIDATVHSTAHIQIDPTASIGYQNGRLAIDLAYVPTHIPMKDIPANFKGCSPSLTVGLLF